MSRPAIRAFFTVACLMMAAELHAQESRPLPVFPDTTLYDNDFLPASFHKSRRDLLRSALPEHGVAVLFAAPVRTRSNDVNYEYHQDPNFYYYTGHREPGAMLMVFREPQTIDGIAADEFIFIRKPDAARETWTGKMAEPADVRSASGIQAVMLNTELDGLGFDFAHTPSVLVAFPDDVTEKGAERGTLGWMVAQFRKLTDTEPVFYNSHALKRINGNFREIKMPAEIGLLRKAVDLTCAGFAEALRSARPGMHEYELENINEFVWKKEGAEHAGYPSIVGGGANSCVLHYETNRKKLLAGDMVVMDMGAEYHGYTADVTRSFPVSGRFTREQKAIYELVLKAQAAGFAACIPGNAFNDPHRAAMDVIGAGLVELGIIKTPAAASTYFMHGTSHYLGLDVHDPGSYGPLKPNSLITVEPGIYIKEGAPCDRKWWNIGVRIEDDVLITAGGHEVLSDCIPRTVAEIEALMSEGSRYFKPE